MKYYDFFEIIGEFELSINDRNIHLIGSITEAFIDLKR